MEPIQETHKASKFAPQDVISTMPDNVITSILHRLPLHDAVMTSILSRNWRFKWTMLSQLKFDVEFFMCLMNADGEINSHGKIISRLLLHLNGAVTKSVIIFTLLDVEDIHHLILFLSRKGIKDLTIKDWSKTQVKLPTHLFSCLELEHLNIVGSCFNPPPSFHGFPNLLSLELFSAQFGSSDLGEFLTRCPLLEILDLGYLSYTGSVKLVEIAKLQNLKILSLSLCHLEATTITSLCDVLELVGYLPKLQELGLDFQDYKLTEGHAKKKFPTAFPSVKALKFTRIGLGNGTMLSCALEMMRHLPNLQTLEITATPYVDDPVPISIPIPILDVEYNMMELRTVVFRNFKGSENEVYLIKYFLACSPSLKKIVVHHDWCLGPGEQLIFAKMLLKLHRASPVAEIDFN
ncbi:putative FBD domain, leucine-rich repeat domain superfamily, F-box-like domain superfamily [Helianthus annuus]|uniref:FBD domain, leucine-rich repeat domain superfamily, F-box-like domain superfamily n=1 Tax=Helianthus annuus TaxID=4232 RepID=A0A9K3H0K6_HELAN|nr:F-box/FBD/LRR-repeat protein At1g13570-like [Helianthus annuus]KAF5762073.1 putative FBD domain, leucine-rich repeat domain superfamily, F-box-like domain superfamily [Helianthus annuus]KAJ0837890.1 putative FBD domain, leucine-rich repeat domain superfamily, F-box-like domain superfamily [Helianthus annuus]